MWYYSIQTNIQKLNTENLICDPEVAGLSYWIMNGNIFCGKKGLSIIDI